MTVIQTIINQALARYHTIRKQRALLVGFTVLAVVIGIVALLDRNYIFNGWVRMSGSVVGLCAAACAARWTAGSSKMDATALAHQIEAEAGESASVVATAIDPEVRLSARNEAVAALLMKRLDLRAARALDAALPTFHGYLRIPSILAVSAIMALGLLVTFKGGTCLLRIIFPWPTLAYTTLVLKGPDTTPAEASPFTLVAQVSGVSVEKVRLYRQGLSQPFMEAMPDAKGRVKFLVGGLSEPTDFVARGGDGQSKSLRILPHLRPTIETFEIVTTFPKYTSKAIKTETRPSFSVVRGSHLRYRVHLRNPAESLVIERSAEPRQEERIQAKLGSSLLKTPNNTIDGESDTPAQKQITPIFKPNPTDPLIWEADWRLTQVGDISYRLLLKGKHGELVRNEEAWHIHVVADAPPLVKIQSHNAVEVLKRGDEKVCFKLSAVDDLKLVTAQLVCRNLGNPHTRQEIKLPVDTKRTWSGEEILDMTPFGMQPLDIVAVHFEAVDDNTLDGPGIGRSEVVYLQVPAPKVEEQKKDNAGGGGGGSPSINPLALQLEILKRTVLLNNNAPISDRAAIAHDQRKNRENVAKMETALLSGGLDAPADILNLAGYCMDQAAETLDQGIPENAVTHMEEALGQLIKASKLLDKLNSNCTKCSSGEKFTLTPPKPKKGAPKDSKVNKDGKSPGDGKKKEELRKLMAEVQRQLAEQEKLNQSDAKDLGKAGKQQGLAQDAKAASGTAKGMEGPKGQPGGKSGAAAELDKAATLQQGLAEALSKGDAAGAASKEMAAQSVESLSNALDVLSGMDRTGIDEGNVNPAGYEQLVGDYLRSISNE